MDHARWEKIEELLQNALDLEPDARSVFLGQACNGDELLRREIETLLSKEPEAERLLQSYALPLFAQGGQTDAAVAGQQLGRDRIDARIGAGGMGEVYKAHDESLARTVAIKMLPVELTTDSSRVRRLEQESRHVRRNDPLT